MKDKELRERLSRDIPEISNRIEKVERGLEILKERMELEDSSFWEQKKKTGNERRERPHILAWHERTRE